MQDLNFGQFIGIVIRNGDPVCDPPPCRKREHKFRAENGPRPERSAEDFVLKSEVVELFAYFDDVQNGTIDILEVKHGVPFRMIITEEPA